MNVDLQLLRGAGVYRLGWTLIHSLWIGAAAAGVFIVLMAILRRRSAQARYLAACAMLALFTGSTVSVFLLVAKPAADAATASVARAESPGAPAQVSQKSVPAISAHLDNQPLPDMAQSQKAPVLPSKSNPIAAPLSVAGAARALEPALPWLVLVWSIGVCVLALWQFAGWIVAERLKRLAVRTADAWFIALADRLAQRNGVRQTVRLLESALVRVPTVMGCLRPVILLPLGFAAGLTPSQVECILIHELAHIRRHDYLINLLQSLVETLLFYHPATWYISRRIRLEREHCCDDCVLACGANQHSYAESLLHLARQSVSHGRTSFVTAGVSATGKPSELRARIGRMLGAREETSRFARGWPTVIVLGLLLLTSSYVFVAKNAQTALADGEKQTTSKDDIVGIWRDKGGNPTRLEFKTDGNYEIRAETGQVLQEGKWKRSGERVSFQFTPSAGSGQIREDAVRKFSADIQKLTAGELELNTLQASDGGLMQFARVEDGAGASTRTGIAAEPTSSTIGKWLEGKDVVELEFAGPTMDLKKLAASFAVEKRSKDFVITSSGHAGADASVEICLKVTPESVPHLLALQTALEARGFHLEGKSAFVWSYAADSAVREKARKMIPDVLAAAEKAVKQALPGATWTVQQPRLPSTLADVDASRGEGLGNLVIYDMTIQRQWGLNRAGMREENLFHLAHLGLIVEIESTRGAKELANGKAPDDEENLAIRQAFRQAVQPLLTLDQTLTSHDADAKPAGRQQAIGKRQLPRGSVEALHALQGDEGRATAGPPMSVREAAANALKKIAAAPGGASGGQSTPPAAQEGSPAPPAGSDKKIQGTGDAATHPAPGAAPAPALSLTLDSDTMQNAVMTLRDQLKLRVDFEDLPYDQANDTISLGDAFDQLQALAKTRPLSPNEKERLKIATDMLAKGTVRTLAFDLKAPRYTGTFTGKSPKELLENLTRNTPYSADLILTHADKTDGAWNIVPKDKSILDVPVRWPKDLDTGKLTIAEAFDKVIAQLPKNAHIGRMQVSMGPVRAGDDPEAFLKAHVGIIGDSPFSNTDGRDWTARRLLTMLADTAETPCVWELNGFTGNRTITVLKAPRAPVVEPATRSGAALMPLLRGSVIGPDGKPAAGWEMNLAVNGKTYQVPCDKNGAYQFAGIPAGEYSLSMNPPGTGQPEASIETMTLHDGKTVVQDFNLAAAFTLSGTVTYRNGAPAVARSVAVTCKSPDDHIEYDNSVDIDAQGRYSVGLPFNNVSDVLLNGTAADGPLPAPIHDLKATAGPANLLIPRDPPAKQVGGFGSGATANARAKFLEVERFARLPSGDQLKGFTAFYKAVAPAHTGEPGGMMLMSYVPENILDRGNRAAAAGNSQDRWAAQLQTAPATQTAEEVADKLGPSVWLLEAAHLRTLQALKQHPEALAVLVKQDLDATDPAAFERGCIMAGQLDLKEFSWKLVEIYLADTARSKAANMALQRLRDPEIVAPLVADIEKNPRHVRQHYELLAGAQWHQPANPTLVKLLDSPDAEIPLYAAYSIYECRDASLAKPLAKLAKDGDPRLVVAALYMAGHLDDSAFAGVRGDFASLLSSDDQKLKVDAIECFAKHKDVQAGPAILAMLKLQPVDAGSEVTILQSLQALAGSTFGYDQFQWGPDKNAAAIAKYEKWLNSRGG